MGTDYYQKMVAKFRSGGYYNEQLEKYKARLSQKAKVEPRDKEPELYLSDYIRQVGSEEFARRFGITRRTTEAYLYGNRYPSVVTALHILDKTPVTLEGIYPPGKLYETRRKEINALRLLVEPSETRKGNWQ